MSNNIFIRLLTACVVAVLLTTSATPVAFAIQVAAPLEQELRSQEVTGVLPGGQFAKIWLGLEPGVAGTNITVTSEWDRPNPEQNGLGFYILDEGGLARVLNGSEDVRDANLAAGSRISPEAPNNQLGAQFRATGSYYTIVAYNDSNADANFTLRVDNGMITDDSGQVTDPNATATSTAEAEDAEAMEEDAAASEDTTVEPEEATAEPAATTPAPAATPEAAETPAPVPVSSQPTEVRGQELSGELPNQNDQHIFGLEPSIANGKVELLLSYDPQDSSELARRLNFWVLDQDGFSRYLDPSEEVILSNIAIAAGSSDPQLESNQRRAEFTASGFGPYVLIVYNNSRIPGTYTIRVDGGILIDDSGQSDTAQSQQSATTTVTSTVSASDTTGGDASAPATETDAAAPATSGREGEPGGTYTVQAGDTLSLIARDIYGEVGLWEEICTFNGLDDCNTIEVGDVLRLPTREEIGAGVSAPAQTPAPAATATPASATATPTTTVGATETPEPEPEDETDAAATEGEDVGATEEVTSTATTTTTTSTDTSDDEATAANIMAALEAAGSFDTLVEALTAANLTSALEGAGPFTVFAPTDAAFDALPPGAMEQLLANPTGQLTQILLFHVLPGSVTSADITDGMQATTQQGQAVNLEVSGDTIKVNGANVVVPDILASNGVVHAIDAVILPPPEE